jgi:malate dehydrogenase (oxaloacetate-decarboxylating)(NADP+)
LAITACGIRHVSNELFLTAARALADAITPADLDQGLLYPPLHKIREVSASIAVAVANTAYKSGLTPDSPPENLREFMASRMYQPTYAGSHPN